MVSESVWRRMLLVGAGLVIAVAAILALGVIPLFRADTSPNASPDTAIPGFLVFVIANALVAAALLGATLVTRRGGCASKVLLGAAGLVALAMGLVLLDGVAAYLADPHPGMQGAAVLLFVCVAADLAAGVLAFTAMGVRLRQRPYLRQLWHDIKTHRLAAALFLVFWLALWGITCVTLYPAVFFLHLLMAFLAGALVGWWRNRNTIADRITGGMLAGLLFSVIGFAIQIIPETTPSLVLEALVMAGFYAVIGMVLGMVGGLIGALLAAELRRE